jgi:hypothetical protein
MILLFAQHTSELLPVFSSFALTCRLSVPLDYLRPEVGNATLSLAKYPATSRPEEQLGTLFLNAGGPGQLFRLLAHQRDGANDDQGNSGVDFIYEVGAEISELVDGRYDIVSWDPRGVNGST